MFAMRVAHADLYSPRYRVVDVLNSEPFDFQAFTQAANTLTTEDRCALSDACASACEPRETAAHLRKRWDRDPSITFRLDMTFEHHPRA